MVSVARLFTAVMLGLVCSAGSAFAAEPMDTSGGRLEVEIETLPEAPYEQEMVLLTIRGFYPYVIALNALEQPDFSGFGWMQLGRDRWYEVPGQQMRGFERVMAIFPHQSGRLEIDPFIHHMTLLAPNGTRFQHDTLSAPLSIEVRPKPAGTQWWLPARALRITDDWDRPADQLGLGQSAVRTVTLEAEGIGPELLPPIPPMRSPGVITFVEPEERTTELTPRGPVSRVTWRWTVKTASSTPATLEAVTIPWFDTTAREPREAVLAPQRIALAGSVAEEAESEVALRLAGYALPLGLLAGFAVGLVLLVPGLRLRSRSELAALYRRLLPDPAVGALRRAARSRDPGTFRQAARQLIRQDREAGLYETLAPEMEERLDSLDRNLFGKGISQGAFDLRGLVGDLLKARRTAAANSRQAQAQASPFASSSR